MTLLIMALLLGSITNTVKMSIQDGSHQMPIIKCNSLNRKLPSFGTELISQTASVVRCCRLPLANCKREYNMLNISCLDQVRQILSSSDPSSKQTCHLPLTKPVSLDAPLCHRHFFLILPWRRSTAYSTSLQSWLKGFPPYRDCMNPKDRRRVSSVWF